ncbi:MAG: methyltransferase domain-containing protein [Pseudomonadota bacterium]
MAKTQPLPATASTPSLVEPGLLARRRDRAMGLGFVGGADFLWREAGAALAERLLDTPRGFGDVVLHGTGAGAIAAALPEKAATRSLVQVDPAPRMVEAARARHPSATTLTHHGETLPFEPASADLALSVLMLHWADDPVGQLVQFRHALRPDGLFLAALFGGRTLAELRAVLATAEAEVSGGLSPRIAPMAEIRDLGGLLQRAGFAMPVADSLTLSVRYKSPIHLMRDLRAMGETNILRARHRHPLPRAVLWRAAELYADHHADTDGRIAATFEIVFLTGWAPAPDQPQPRRPGSATTRLAEALGTVEIPSGDKPRPR